ncbi:MAG: hypothetical protein IPL40_07085 [Proteobacteria bacterium]|nr:hypothetical protein [Pseudomonadota bacterium]
MKTGWRAAHARRLGRPLARRAADAALLALLSATLGCGATLGDFCHDDDDCAGALRCSASAGARGVCVYADALQALDGGQRSTDGGASGRDGR